MAKALEENKLYLSTHYGIHYCFYIDRLQNSWAKYWRFIIFTNFRFFSSWRISSSTWSLISFSTSTLWKDQTTIFRYQHQWSLTKVCSLIPCTILDLLHESLLPCVLWYAHITSAVRKQHKDSWKKSSAIHGMTEYGGSHFKQFIIEYTP